MKNFFKKVIFFCLWYSGLAFLYRLLTKKRVRILCYHSIEKKGNFELTVSLEKFKKQLFYLKKHYQIVDLGKLIELLSLKQYSPLAVALTFDDGYQNNYTKLLPLLEYFNFRATIFLCPDFIGRGVIPASISGGKDLPALSWEEIKKMTKKKITFGSHTLSHINLGKEPIEKVKRELKESKEIIEFYIAKPISFFAYPFGKKEDFNEFSKQAIKNAGFKTALTIEEGTISLKDDLFELKRLVIFDEPLFCFKVRVSGIIDDLKNFINKIFKK